MHRDIKPDNVLIGDDGRVVLADFGVAAIADDSGGFAGTDSILDALYGDRLANS